MQQNQIQMDPEADAKQQEFLSMLGQLVDHPVNKSVESLIFAFVRFVSWKKQSDFFHMPKEQQSPILQAEKEILFLIGSQKDYDAKAKSEKPEEKRKLVVQNVSQFHLPPIYNKN